MQFTTALFDELLSNLYNDFNDNHDYYRFGRQIEQSAKGIKGTIVRFINKMGYHRVKPYSDFAISRMKEYDHYLKGFEFLYNLLADDYSKRLLVKVLAYRLLGKRKVRLPLNNPEFWNTIERIEKENTNKEDFIDVKNLNIRLKKIKLHSLGYNLQLYYTPAAVYYDFVFNCYSYPNSDIKVKKGDIVIDAGGCYGDTALQFAHDAGSGGKVLSFEFIPSNKKIWQTNIDLNDNVKPQIVLIDRPLWDESNLEVFYKDLGPGSKVSFSKDFEPDGTVKTITIDDLVRSEIVNRVDFIKMDIEGAEMRALIGAQNTLKTFKPRLAISLYHSPEDFYRIPKFLNDLNSGYKFFFNHYTIHQEESVLFAIAE